jgi:FkbM family methyltransferase
MAILSGPDGQVLSFEPIEYLVDKALESESINDHSNCASIKRFPVALSDKDGESSIYIWDSNVGASMVIDGEIPDNYMQWGSHSKKIIKTKRLDSIFNEKIDFIKIDVENHEELVFKGFGKNAQECPVIIAELGNQQPVKFLEELSHIYNMSRLDGVPADVNEIMKHGIINILLEKK